MQCKTLDTYLETYGRLLGLQAGAAVDSLHVPGRDAPLDLALLRPAYPAQAHVITACVKAWHRQKALILVGDCGTGKSLCAAAIAHAHAEGRPYRGLVFAPPHLLGKWQREIEETIPGAWVHTLSTYRDVCSLYRIRNFPRDGVQWFLISQSAAKLGTGWTSVWRESTHERGIARCVHCSWPVERKDTETGVMVPLELEVLAKKQLFCVNCGEPLWTYNKQFNRWPVARFIHKRLKGFFDYLVIDEAHQEKGEDTAQANAAGALVAAVPKVIAMTGTLIGGYADHLRTLLFRLAPQSLVADGLGWSDKMPFNERYGRIEKKIIEKHAAGKRNSYSRGSSTRTQKFVRPGVMPTLFGEHLLALCVFLSLDEMADQLPPLEESVIETPLDDELNRNYAMVEDALTSHIKGMIAKGNKKLLGAMLSTLLGYPDRPYGWGEIGYYEVDKETGAQLWVPVVKPPDLSPFTVRPKERALVEAVLREHGEGRQCWVFSPMSDTRDVLARLGMLLEAEGLRVKILRSHEVPTKEREAWIFKHGRDHDVILSHPQLVETGLDLFDKGGSHNFCTLIFYQSGYNLFTLIQASLRHYRLAQTQLCRTLFLYYGGTMQARAMTLMGKKMAASRALQGKFSADGLVALADDGETLAMELAKSLVHKLDDLDAGRQWQKIVQQPHAIAPEPTAKPIVLNPRPTLPEPMQPIKQLALFEEVA